jgi:hypothetical protein
MTKQKDIGVDDPERAAQNRKMVKEKRNAEAYERVENYLSHTPLNRCLPAWVPTDELPVVGKEDWRQSGGDKVGLHEVEEDT